MLIGVENAAVAATGSSAILLVSNMNSAHSVQKVTNSRAVPMIQFLIGLALTTSCSGNVDNSIDGSAQALGGSASVSGGSSSTTGGSGTASGGTSSISDLDTCSSDSDCVTCQWTTAPADSTQCDSGWNCCYGVPLALARCLSNEAAWTTNCANTKHVPCPCVYEICSAACVSGVCTGSCGIPQNY